MPTTIEDFELDAETREDLARWQHYVETGEAIPHERVMAWLDALAAEADTRAPGRLWSGSPVTDA